MDSWIESGGILIFHVPAAIMTYVGFVACTVINIGIALGKQWPLWTARAACDGGLAFAGITLATGMVWARAAWGTAWLWEPRLTGMFLMTLIFASWRLTSGIIARRVAAHRGVTSMLIVIGLPAIAFTHLATKIMGGVHPETVAGTHGAEAFSTAQFAAVLAAYIVVFAAVVVGHAFRNRSNAAKDERASEDAE